MSTMSVLAIRSPWPSIARRSSAPARSFRYPVVPSPEPSSTPISQFHYPHHLSHWTLHPTYPNYPPLPSSVDRHLEETAVRSIRCTHFSHPCPARRRGNPIRMHSIEYPPSRLSAPWRRRDASRSGNLVLCFRLFLHFKLFF